MAALDIDEHTNGKDRALFHAFRQSTEDVAALRVNECSLWLRPPAWRSAGDPAWRTA